MLIFDIGETVIISVAVKDDSGAYTDPQTSMKISITRGERNEAIAEAGMTPDSTGKYHYDLQTRGLKEDFYTIKYIATDGTRITIEKDTFKLE